jgi:hypothetical protein
MLCEIDSATLFDQLTEEEKLYNHFMQDNDTAHTVDNSMLA